MNMNSEKDLTSEDDIRAVLRPYRIDAGSFEAGVRGKIQAAMADRANHPLSGAPELLRFAASVFLPLPVITGGKVAGTAPPLAHAAGFSKLLGYVALPAISLFVMLGALVFGAARIRSVQRNSVPAGADLPAMEEATYRWWRQNKWLAGLFMAATLILPFIGATSLLLLLYLISLGMLLFMLSGLAKRGLGDRRLIGGSCVMGLALLGQASMIGQFGTIGQQDIHFVDQMLLPAIFFGGVLILMSLLILCGKRRVPLGDKQPRWPWLHRWTQRSIGVLLVLMALLFVLMIAWFTHATWRPVTPARIKAHVESFHKAPYLASSWSDWEIVASWAIEAGLDPDLSSARRLLAAEAPGIQDPFVLGSAFRVGLVRLDQMDRLSNRMVDYDAKRHALLDDPYGVMVSQQIPGLNQIDWVIRAALLRNDLTLEERDFLAKRLHINLEEMANNPFRQLEEALRVTQLLLAIGRPVDPERYRGRMHELLREFHASDCGFFQDSGGFKTFLNLNSGSLQATAFAVELMQIYGVPDGLDLNQVRSFLRPKFARSGDQAYIAAVTLARLNSLPGVSQPTWLDYVYYERSLIMALLLVGLCIYATLSSPMVNSDSAA